MTTFTVTTHGSGSWTAPSNVVSPVTVECWGAGGGGGGDSDTAAAGGSGGGGGEYASDSVAVTGGNLYSYTVGQGGSGGTGSNGTGGGNTTFTGDSKTVTAHGGGGGVKSSSTPGSAGSGSTNSTHHNGGAGGAGSSSATAGAGGGGSGGSAAAGNAGTSGASGGAGATAVTGGGPGGSGAGTSTGNGNAPSSGPGGGGGGSASRTIVCVDVETEIYTRRGFVKWDELSADETLSIDPASGEHVWVPIERVYVHLHEEWKFIHLEGEFSVRATPHHGWLVMANGNWAWRTTETLRSGDLIPVLGDRFVPFDSLKISFGAEKGHRWCPQTPTGTWLARRHGIAFWTGDAVSEDGGRSG